MFSVVFKVEFGMFLDWTLQHTFYSRNFIFFELSFHLISYANWMMRVIKDRHYQFLIWNLLKSSNYGIIFLNNNRKLRTAKQMEMKMAMNNWIAIWILFFQKLLSPRNIIFPTQNVTKATVIQRRNWFQHWLRLNVNINSVLFFPILDTKS